MLDLLTAYDFKKVDNIKQLANLGMIIQNSFRNSVMRTTHVWLRDPHMKEFHPNNFVWSMPVIKSSNNSFIVKDSGLNIDRDIEGSTPIIIPIGSYYRVERDAIYIATTFDFGDSREPYIVRCFYKDGFTDFQKVFRGIKDDDNLTSV